MENGMGVIETVWGVVILIGGGVAWLSQVICAVSPRNGARWGLAETRESVDPVIWIDNQAEARWDALSLWVLPLAGILLLLGHPLWPYLGLVGSGMYLYFAGRALLQRRLMLRGGVQVGTPGFVRLVYGFMGICVVLAAVTIGLAGAALN
jgi:hypothetical protein